MRFNILAVALFAKLTIGAAIAEPADADLEARQCTFVKCADGNWRVSRWGNKISDGGTRMPC